MSKLDKVLSVLLWVLIVVFAFAGAQLIFHWHNYTAAVYCYLADIWVFAYTLLRDSKRNSDRLLDNAMTNWRGCIDALGVTSHRYGAVVRRCAGLILALKRAAVKKREYLQMKRQAEREKVIDWQVMSKSLGIVLSCGNNTRAEAEKYVETEYKGRENLVYIVKVCDTTGKYGYNPQGEEK